MAKKYFEVNTQNCLEAEKMGAKMEKRCTN